MNNSYTYTITDDVANYLKLFMSVNIGNKENNYKFLIGFRNSITSYSTYSGKT